MRKSILTTVASTIVTISAFVLMSCSSISSSPPTYSPNNYNTPIWNGNTATVWSKLQHRSPAKLAEMRSNTSDPVQSAWIELALIGRQKSTNTQALASELRHWRERNPAHPANQLIPNTATLDQLQAAMPPQKIAVLLPQHGSYGASGQATREGFLNSYYANLSKAGKQNVKFYDTSQEQNIAELYRQAIADGADVIIGPLVKEHVQQLKYAGRLAKPTLALNYTDNRRGSANFFEFGLLPEDEAGQIADRAREAGQARAIVIAPDTAWGKRLAAAFTQRWQTNGGRIQTMWYYTAKENFTQSVAHLLNVDPEADKKLMKQDNNKTVLEQQRRHDFDVIFLFAQPQEARTIVSLLRYYYANDIPIYATSSVYSGKPNPTRDVDLNGVIVCDIPWNMHAQQSASKEEIPTDRLYAVGQDAYLLSQTLQRLTLLPNFPIYGTTGALALSEQHQIHRRLPCVAIRNGLL